MKTLIFNESQLKENEIDETVTRVKIFLINNENKLFIAMSNGGIQLPGGHVEENEDLIDTVKREILEEVGISIESKEISFPFFEIKYYNKNYHNSNKNRISNIIYYLVRTDKCPDITKINLTEDEVRCDFKINQVDLNGFEDYIKSHIEEEGKNINKVIIEEIMLAYNELRSIV